MIRLGLVSCLAMSLALTFHQGSAQCSPPPFTIPATACIGQNIPIVNSNVASAYAWDFCDGGVEAAPAVSTAFTSTTFLNPSNISLVQDNGFWYGFITGRSNGKLVRLDFGNSLLNPPGIVDLGTFNGALAQPIDIELYSEAGRWYGLLIDATLNKLWILSFNGITDSHPTLTSLDAFNAQGYLNIPVDLEIMEEGGKVYALIANYLSGNVTVVRFGTSITNVPTGSNFSVTGGFLRGVGTFRNCAQWNAWITVGNNAMALTFNQGLDMAPVINVVTPTSISMNAVVGVDFVWNNSVLYALLQSENGNVYRLKNAETLTPSGTDLGVLTGQTSTNNGLKIIQSGSDLFAFTVNFDNSRITPLQFLPSCSSSVAQSFVQQPLGVNYSAAGTYHVTLKTQNSDGTWNSNTKMITVTSAVAPDIDFTSINNCVNNAVNFTSVNTSGGIISYNWNFGDSGTSTGQNTSHTYLSPGSYNARLTVTGSNGCGNLAQRPISIFNIPVANFTLPSASPVCTNQSYLLTNTSVFDTGSAPGWEWRINGVLVSTQQDLTAAFASAVSQQIKLKALVPGCENEVTKNISTVLPGASVSFFAQDDCVGKPISFANSTTGADAGFVWDFGDTGTSISSNPTHAYSAAGTFIVKLTGASNNGCQNFATQSVRAFSVPQPDFTVGLPPFSCAQSDTPFQNATPALPDSNIVDWFWEFGDALNGVSSDQDPSYAYASSATYTVTLSATSDVGCAASLSKQVMISPSPTADFVVGPSCLNQPTKFTDNSSGGVQFRSWQIGSGSFTTQNPTYTFTSPGDFTATLAVTSANNCTNVKSKVVHVPVPPVVSFNYSNACASQNASFVDVTNSPSDVVTGWNWNFSGNAATGNPAAYNFLSPGTYNVKLTTTHASGCRYTASKDVPINASPVASFTASPERGAAPLTVKFTNTSQQANGYSWKFYDKVTSISTSISPVYTFASLGDYSAELTATNTSGCSNVRTVPITVLVPSVDLIMQNFSLAPDAATGKLRCLVTIMNASNVPIANGEVALFLADKAVVNENLTLNLNPGQVIATTLSFTLSPNQFDFSFLCAEILSEKDVQPDNNKRCIQLANNDYLFNPYPNPSQGQVHVDWITQQPGSTSITVYDNSGKRLYSWETQSKTGLNQTLHDFTQVSPGLYYLTIQTPVTRHTMRFLRE